MGSYQKNMAAAVRWAIVATILVAAFWLIWNAIAGSVPTVRSIDIRILGLAEWYLGTFSLPLPYSRWWDIPSVFVLTLTFWPLAYGFGKLAPHLGIKAGKESRPPSMNLKVGLAIGLICGLILEVLLTPFLGLAVMLFITLAAFVMSGLEDGWGSLPSAMLGLWLGASIVFSLLVGLGIGWVIGLTVTAAVFLLATLVANLVIGFRGFTPSLRGALPGFRQWLAAEDIEE